MLPQLIDLVEITRDSSELTEVSVEITNGAFDAETFWSI